MSAQLPHPLNGAEQYLAAMYDRLGDILDRLPERPAPGGQVDGAQPEELREPAAPPAPTQPEPGPVDITEPGQPERAATPKPARTARKPATRKAAAKTAAAKASTNSSRKET